MNATEDVGWLDSPKVLNECIERLKAVKAVGLDAGLDFHGRLHRPMAKQLAKLLASCLSRKSDTVSGYFSFWH